MQISVATDKHDIWTLEVEALAESKVNQKELPQKYYWTQPYVRSQQYSSIQVLISTSPDTHPARLL